MSTLQPGSNYAREIWQKDKDHHLHPWQLFDSFGEEGALIMDRAEGAWLVDIEGNRYLDAVGGLWCTNIGLGREEMIDAVAEQMRKMAYASPFVDMTNQPAAELAAKLASLAPGSLNHVMFGCGGSTAIDSAYRLIQFYQNCRGKPEKKHVIARDASYHGTTYLAMSIGGKKADHPPEFDYKRDNIHHVASPNYYRADPSLSEAQFLDSLIDELEQKIHDIGADNIAAFFAEPIPGAGGVIVPPEGYHRRTWELCKANDILYVSDEVVTAFGRLGEWFASDSVFGIKPDIITCAKGLTSGYLPLGATLYSDEIHNVISEPGQGRYFAHGFTYSGHPVSCAAALKNIEIMERENLFEHARDVGGYFEKRIRSLQDLPIVGQVRGKKLMQCVEFVADKATRKVFPESLDIGKVISDIADKKGLLVRPIINLNVMSPPLVITHDEIDIIIDTLAESIEEATKQLQKSGDWTPPA
jgi:adenosylmethionine-8-amino-7-oxononanoate aminotransferase